MMNRSEEIQVCRLLRMIENRDKSLSIEQWEDMLLRQAKNVREVISKDPFPSERTAP